MKLDAHCGACGGNNYARHKFCGWCGAELIPRGCPDHAMTDVTSPGLGAVDSTIPGQPGADAPMSTPTPAAVAVDGMVVSMLGDVERGRKSNSSAVLYRLELGEPFDVDGPNLQAPGTFTATTEGLRLDSLGSLEGVYRCVSRDEKPIAYRRLRVIRELGTFQALAPGECIPIGALAILDRVLIRVEPR